VGQLLAQKGAALLDSDALVRELYADREFAGRVAQLFETHFWDAQGQKVRPILEPNGGVDRAALAALVFRDAGALRKLEVLVHPEVAALRERKLEALRARENAPRVVVIEAVKLIESGQHRGCDCLWWIRAAPETQLQRLMQNRAMGEAAALSQLAHQPSHQAKRALAGDVPLCEIWNDGSLNELETRVEGEWARLIK